MAPALVSLFTPCPQLFLPEVWVGVGGVGVGPSYRILGRQPGWSKQLLPRMAVRTGGGSSHRAARCHCERKIAVHLRSHGLRKGLPWAPNPAPSLGAIGAKTVLSFLVRLFQDLSCSWRLCPRHLMRVRFWGLGTLQGSLAKVSYDDDSS